MSQAVIDMIVAMLRGTQSRFVEGDVTVRSDSQTGEVTLSRSAAQQLVKEAYGADPKEESDPKESQETTE